MQIDEVKALLCSYQVAKRKLRTAKENLDAVEAQIYSISISYGDKVQSTPEIDKLAGAIDRLNKLRNVIIEQAGVVSTAMEQVYGIIQQVQDEKLNAILSMRYIQGYTWERVAVNINYTYRRTLQLHGVALLEVQRILQDIS